MPLLNNLLILLALLIILFVFYRTQHQIWMRHQLSQKKKTKQPRKPPVFRLKSECDCRFCQEEKRKRAVAEREIPLPWRLQKGKGGPKKKVTTAGYFCPNKSCEYYGDTEDQTHALVGDDRHGVHEAIREIKCQACGKKFTARRNTVLYR